eukprot:768744-Hanusia_phi.AAC.7
METRRPSTMQQRRARPPAASCSSRSMSRSRRGASDLAPLLSFSFADTNFKDSYFRTPIHIAAMVGASSALEANIMCASLDLTRPADAALYAMSRRQPGGHLRS